MLSALDRTSNGQRLVSLHRRRRQHPADEKGLAPKCVRLPLEVIALRELHGLPCCRTMPCLEPAWLGRAEHRGHKCSDVDATFRVTRRRIAKELNTRGAHVRTKCL